MDVRKQVKFVLVGELGTFCLDFFFAIQQNQTDIEANVETLKSDGLKQ